MRLREAVARGLVGERHREHALAALPHVVHALDGGHPARADECDAVARALHFVEQVRRKQDGGAAALLLKHEVDEAALHEGVEAAGGFVQQDDVGRGHECAHQAHLLLRALRHLADAPRGVQLEVLDQLVHARAVAQLLHARHEFQEGRAGHLVHAGDLARQVAQALLDAAALAEAVQAVDAHGALIRPNEAHEVAHGHGFPGAVRPQEAEHLAAFHGERHVEHAAAVAVVFLEPLEFDHGVAHRYSSLMRQEDGVAISSPPVLFFVRIGFQHVAPAVHLVHHGV